MVFSRYFLYNKDSCQLFFYIHATFPQRIKHIIIQKLKAFSSCKSYIQVNEFIFMYAFMSSIHSFIYCRLYQAIFLDRSRHTHRIFILGEISIWVKDPL